MGGKVRGIESEQNIHGDPFTDEGRDEQETEDERPIVERLCHRAIDIADVADDQIEEGSHEYEKYIHIHPPCHSHFECGNKVY